MTLNGAGFGFAVAVAIAIDGPMKNSLFTSFIIALAGCWFCSSASAQLADFNRQWKNTRSNTDSFSKMEISTVNTNISLHLFGACTPVDCDLGATGAIAYGKNVSADLSAKASALTAEYTLGFVEIRLVIYRLGRNRLRVESFTHFADGSDRTDYHSTDVMRPLRSNEEF